MLAPPGGMFELAKQWHASAPLGHTRTQRAEAAQSPMLVHAAPNMPAPSHGSPQRPCSLDGISAGH